MWKDVAVRAPAEGIVTYPQGTGPVRVARGTVVARISSGNRLRGQSNISRDTSAALDGMEQSWRYSELWPGFQPLPEPSPLNRLKDGLLVGKGQPVGKPIEQPQELRFMGYTQTVGNMDEQIKSNKLRVKMDGVDTVSVAEIRVSTKAGTGPNSILLCPGSSLKPSFQENIRLRWKQAGQRELSYRRLQS